MENVDDPTTFEPKTAREAYEGLQPRLAQISQQSLTTIRSPLVSVLTAVQAVAREMKQPERRARFEALPGFDMSHLDDLERMAAAYWYATVQLRSARVRSSQVRVDAALVERASERKRRMLQLLEYHLSDLPLVERELAEVRSGQGYEDLASDLVRLAELHEAHRGEIVGDTRHYLVADASEARADALQIMTELAEHDEGARSWVEAARRCAALLDHAYREVSAAAAWIYRNDPTLAELIPSLHGLARKRRGPPQSVQPPAIPAASAPAPAAVNR